MIANSKEGLLKRISCEFKRHMIEETVREVPILRHLYPEKITYRDTFLDRLRFYFVEFCYRHYKK